MTRYTYRCYAVDGSFNKLIRLVAKDVGEAYELVYKKVPSNVTCVLRARVKIK